MTATAPVPAALLAEAADLATSLLPPDNRFRERQADDGTIPQRPDNDAELLEKVATRRRTGTGTGTEPGVPPC